MACRMQSRAVTRFPRQARRPVRAENERQRDAMAEGERFILTNKSIHIDTLQIEYSKMPRKRSEPSAMRLAGKALRRAKLRSWSRSGSPNSQASHIGSRPA